ncbi:MAG: DUF3592 domain-containing protein [Sphingomonadales bacterium]|nr:MAG: DUF3592 domain-containing protein [Sphingomonadales bacterium]
MRGSGPASSCWSPRCWRSAWRLPRASRWRSKGCSAWPSGGGAAGDSPRPGDSLNRNADGRTAMDIFIAIGLGLALVGAPLAWYGVHSYRKQGERYAGALSGWAKTAATVIDARLVDREIRDREGDSSLCYEPRLHYRYSVAGAELDGKNTALCVPPLFTLFETAQQWLLAHSPGREIDLWYDPAHPEDSTPLLDKPSLFRAMAMLAVGTGFMAFGGALMLRLI